MFEVNMIRALHFLLLLAFLSPPVYSASMLSTKVTPEEILRKADEVRNPAQSYSMKVSVLSESKKDSLSLFEVLIDGNQKTLIRTLSPSRDQGRNMLMLGEEMWAFIPNLNRAVRVSLAQKLSGQAANGDISRMRWSGDYSATIENETAQEWVLYLTAGKKGLTYDKIRVWIEKFTFYPKKAEYLSFAGKPLKLAFFSEYRTLAGKVRPSVLRIQDAVRPDEVSLIQIQDMVVKSYPAALFSQNGLK
jgi:outer membrane lipoprotein-sorting protein